MRLALLGLNYAPEPVGIGPYTAGLATALVEAGWTVDVVTAKPYYPGWALAPGWRWPLWHREPAGRLRVTRCPLYVPRDPSALLRVLHHLSFAMTAVWPILRAALRWPDVVLVIAPSLLSVPLGWLAAWLCGAQLWVHVQDFEVEAAVATGLARSGPLARAALALEDRLLRSANLVSTISPAMRERLLAKGVAPERTAELRNWANSFAPTASGVARYRLEWGLGDRAVALYSGNIANKQGIDILIEAARQLTARDDIALVICGDGPNRSALAAAAAGLPNVSVRPLQPAERMSDLLALATVHLLPQLPDAADLVLPSKLTNMLASGRPVIATAAPGTGLHDEVDGCGMVTPPGDAAALATAIAALVDDQPRATALGGAAAARAAERWSAAVILPRFVAAATQLAEASTGEAVEPLATTLPVATTLEVA